MTRTLTLTALLMGIAACSEGGLTTDELQNAAEERVRDSLGLTAQSTLFTNVAVGRPRDGDPVLCGTVSGETAAGETIPPRRFIAATDPAHWIKFEPAAQLQPSTAPDMFVEWETYCSNAARDDPVEPLAPTEVGER